MNGGENRNEAKKTQEKDDSNSLVKLTAILALVGVLVLVVMLPVYYKVIGKYLTLA